MSRNVLAVVGTAALLLAGCVEETGFGGSGGSFGGGGFGGSGGSFGGGGSSGLSLGREICLDTARQQGLNVARVDSVEEYGFGSAGPRGVQVRMQVRRDAMTVSTEPRVCRFTYSNGLADISRT
ncbi:hypothetical protein [Roseicyclus sp.]|uniref:hypothetical protein n=1 Tax=Roseicyclus sp. TaxID=1914329 RepID=UPI003FA0DDFF